jgi:signal transduction histidine kinase
MRPRRRTALAATLIGVAVLLPTGAWFVTGSREAARTASVLEAEAELQVRTALDREAARLGTRLGSLRDRESDRPFYHYQTLYHDPRGAAQGLSVTPSPLASGNPDPLVWAHFQIDEAGLVTLPTVSERFPELSSDADFAAFCTLLEELQHAVVIADDSGRVRDGVDEERVLTISESEWEQILLAESVYASITGRPEEADPRVFEETVGQVFIHIRPLDWHTMVLGSGPALAALREVHTPAGVLLQGFTIAPDAVLQWLGSVANPLRFSPASQATTDALTAVVADSGWILQADAAHSLALGADSGRAVVAQFRRTFAFSATAIILAAAAVVLILLQTDRLASQRARFAAAAAHELKTPLSGLLLHAEMLAEDLGDPDHRALYAKTVATEAERLGRVVTNMLDLSRLERGASLADPRPGDLGAAVMDRVDRQRRRLEEAGATLEIEIGPELPTALFDIDALGQILDNLLDNAEKHTRSVDQRRIRVDVDGNDDLLRVAVSDNGPGIPRQERRDLFRPFDRSGAADGTPGLGLGLALARSLARAQDGDLELSRDDHPGATFVLTLRRA